MKNNEDNKLTLDGKVGYVPNDFKYVSGMPYVEVSAIYASERACLRGDAPIKIESIRHIDPGYEIDNGKFRSALSTIYPKTPEETNKLLRDVLILQVKASEGKFMDLPHLPMGSYYKPLSENSDVVILSLKDMKVPPNSEDD